MSKGFCVGLFASTLIGGILSAAWGLVHLTVSASRAVYAHGGSHWHVAVVAALGLATAAVLGRTARSAVELLSFIRESDADLFDTWRVRLAVLMAVAGNLMMFGIGLLMLNNEL